MAKKTEDQKTTLHEVVVHLNRFEKPLICQVDADEANRLISAVEAQREKPPSFYGFDLVDGLECYLGLAHVARIGILDILAGLPFRKPPKKADKQWEKQIAERDESEDPVILRVWMSNEAPEVSTYHDVDYHEWCIIRTSLEESDQSFVGFTDEDGERVILSVAFCAAIEVYDTHYLSEEELDRILKDDSDVPKEPPTAKITALKLPNEH